MDNNTQTQQQVQENPQTDPAQVSQPAQVPQSSQPSSQPEESQQPQSEQQASQQEQPQEKSSEQQFVDAYQQLVEKMGYKFTVEPFWERGENNTYALRLVTTIEQVKK